MCIWRDKTYSLSPSSVLLISRPLLSDFRLFIFRPDLEVREFYVNLSKVSQAFIYWSLQSIRTLQFPQTNDLLSANQTLLPSEETGPEMQQELEIMQENDVPETSSVPALCGQEGILWHSPSCTGLSASLFLASWSLAHFSSLFSSLPVYFVRSLKFF